MIPSLAHDVFWFLCTFWWFREDFPSSMCSLLTLISWTQACNRVSRRCSPAGHGGELVWDAVREDRGGDPALLSCPSLSDLQTPSQWFWWQLQVPPFRVSQDSVWLTWNRALGEMDPLDRVWVEWTQSPGGEAGIPSRDEEVCSRGHRGSTSTARWREGLYTFSTCHLFCISHHALNWHHHCCLLTASWLLQTAVFPIIRNNK